MNLIDRAKKILLSPKSEWPVIEQETHTIKDLYLSYVVPLAGTAALAGLVGAMLWGYSAGPVSMKLGFGSLVGIALTSFVMTLISVAILAWIVSALAPTFKGEKNLAKAFAVAAFAMTGAMVGAMAAILPALSTLLALVGALYSLYLLYTGLPVVMKSPPEKALGYTAVVVIAAIVCNVILGALAARFTLSPWSTVGAGIGAGQSTEITIKTPAGQVSTTQGKLEEMGRKLEQAAAKAERAGEQKDPQAVSQAAAEAIAAITGAVPGGNRVALTSETLKAWLPERIGAFARQSFEVQGGAALGIVGSTARAVYRDGDRKIDLEVLDAGGASAILAMLSGLHTGQRETETSSEKSYQSGKRKVTEKRWKDGSQSELSVVLDNGVMVSAKGERVAFEALESAVRGLGLDKLEAIQPAAPATTKG